MKYHGNHIVIVLMLLLVPSYLISCSGTSTNSQPSAASQVVSKNDPPDVPTSLTAVGANGQVRLTWTPPDGATSYNLYWSMTGTVTEASNKIWNISMPYTHMDLLNDKTYHYCVSAVNVYGESLLSAEVQATPREPFTRILTKVTDPDLEINDQFGFSVSISGDYAIVGAPWSWGLIPGNVLYQDAGAAYIFQRVNGIWDTTNVARLAAPDGQSGDQFGYSVSISGDSAIVGTRREDGGDGDPLIDSGAAYIYHRNGPNTWTFETKLISPDAQAYGTFGCAVAISGDYAVVGEKGPARAYVFHRKADNTWDAGTSLSAPDVQINSNFGFAVAINGDYAIIGAREAGAVYIFHRTDVNAWNQYTKIMPFDAEEGDHFGYSVALSGNYAAVGAIRKADNRGAVYVYHRLDENFWDEGPKMIASDPQEGDNFGYSVAITDKYLLVGAYIEDCGWDDNNAEGSAYLFERTGTNTWDSGTKITVQEGNKGDYFGYAVSLSEESAIIGATGYDGNSSEGRQSGAAYIY